MSTSNPSMFVLISLSASVEDVRVIGVIADLGLRQQGIVS